MKRVLKIVLIVIIAAFLVSTCGRASYNRGFMDGAKYHQQLVQDICHPSSYSTTMVEEP